MNNWNEPEKGENPWAGKETDPFEQLKKQFNNFFGQKNSDGGNNSNIPSKKIIFSIITVVLIIWLISGTYIVENAERGVVTRFGQFTYETEKGLNWRLPYPIEEVELVNVGIVRGMNVGFRQSSGKVLNESLMLTQDENIIDVQLAVQYQISNARKFLFTDSNPIITLRQIIESVLREVVGRSKMDFVLTDGRTEVAEKVMSLAQESLNQFDIGISITNVNMQDAQAPEQVQSAFDDAVKAREDKERFINEAQAYSNKILPKARGESARITQEAEAYKQQVVAKADGETQRFNDIYKEYSKAPKVTKERLYIDSMEQVLKQTSKVIVDVEGGNNLLYLPLDKLIQNAAPANQSGNNNLYNNSPTNLSNNSRNRTNSGARTR